MTARFTNEEVEIASTVLRQLAPDELPLLQQLASKPGLLDRFQSDSVGYGIDVDLSVVAPYALLLATWARGIVTDEARQTLEKRLRSLTRRVLREKEAKQPPALPASMLTHEELESTIEEYAQVLGMKKAKARLLAQAIAAQTLKKQQ